MDDLKQAENAIDFLLVLGQYYRGRIMEARKRVASSVNPWDGKAFLGGVAGLIYMFALIAFLAVLLYDGFGRHSQRNSALLFAIVILFILSFLK